MIQLDGHDETVLRNMNSNKQISPAGLANVLNCPRKDAKLILQRMAGRGVLRGLATGWFEKAEWNATQPKG